MDREDELIALNDGAKLIKQPPNVLNWLVRLGLLKVIVEGKYKFVNRKQLLELKAKYDSAK